MRQLVLLRGAPGAGKSRFLRDNNLEQYALCADNIRLLIQSPDLDLEGNPQISQKNDKTVWKLLFEMLETRMGRGEFTIIDATHQKADQINDYRELCKTYRYRCYVIDMTDVPLDTCLAQNNQREAYKRVPEQVIRNAYSRFASQHVPGWVTVIKPEDFSKTFNYTPTDKSKYDRIHVIGDVQGCHTALTEYFDTYGHPSTNTSDLYVFVGDLLDRGIENDKVLQEALNLYQLRNVVLLEGNHEAHIRDWANDKPISSKDFIYNTKPQLEAADIDKKKVRELCRKFSQIAYYWFHGKVLLITHGGIPTVPSNLMHVATEQFIKGVGRYEDDIDQIFTKNCSGLYIGPDGSRSNALVSNVYQVHGHRNILGLPTQAGSNSYNLEGKVEFGGQLRVVVFTATDIEIREIANSVFKPKPVKQDTVQVDSPLLDRLKASKSVQEKQFGNISSFNFTRKVFDTRKWSDEAIKARGLFINTVTGEIVAKSYDKFFNVNEREETKIVNLEQVLQFPVDVYDKPNGFLGLAGYDSETDQVVLASKSTIQGPYRDWFHEIFMDTLDGQVDDWKNVLKQSNLTGVFEVIDPVNDPHIVEYSKREIILLDMVHRQEAFGKWDYRQVKGVAKSFGLSCKQHVTRLDTWRDFFSWYEHITQQWLPDQEGFVLEDPTGFMFKIKLPWYSHWKLMRKVKEIMSQKGNPKVNASMLTTPEANAFYGWLKGFDQEILKTRDIISLRKEFEAR